MAYRNKTYICFDGDNDMSYYRLMTAWAKNDKIDFDIYNAHDLNTSRDSSQEKSIKRQLRERLANSKVLLVLIGEKTKNLTKFVKWEMEVALKLGLPIIGVNLNDSRKKDSLCPPVIAKELAIYAPFGAKIINHALKKWPNSYAKHKNNGDNGPYFYVESVYEDLGLNKK